MGLNTSCKVGRRSLADVFSCFSYSSVIIVVDVWNGGMGSTRIGSRQWDGTAWMRNYIVHSLATGLASLHEYTQVAAEEGLSN